jgi:hypothetical protein
MEKLTKQELTDKINNWSYDVGESFYDYFCHDNILPISYGMYLISKGFEEHGNNIIRLYIEDKGYVGQEEQYEVYPVYVGQTEEKEGIYTPENEDKNLEIMVEFLLASDSHYIKLEKWLLDEYK